MKRNEEYRMKEAFWELCPEVIQKSFLFFPVHIHRRNGLDQFLQAYRTVRNQDRNLPHLVISGAGLATAYGQKLARQVRLDPSLCDSVSFLDSLYGLARQGAFYSCEAFILSAREQHFGFSLAETMAYAKPLLVICKYYSWLELLPIGAGIMESDSLMGAKDLLERFLALSWEEKAELGLQAQAIYAHIFAQTRYLARNIPD